MKDRAKEHLIRSHIISSICIAPQRVKGAKAVLGRGHRDLKEKTRVLNMRKGQWSQEN